MRVAAKRNPRDTVEHKKRKLDKWSARGPAAVRTTYGEIEKIDEGPGYFLGHTGDGVNYDFSRDNQDDMYEPCTWERVSNKRCGIARQIPFALTQSALMLR